MSRGLGIVLYSGGLDSLLAARVLMDQDLEIIGYHCVLPFIAPDAIPDNLYPIKLAAQIHLPVEIHRCEDEYIDMIRNPLHGYGKNANPCIDCHIYFIKKAAEFMKDIQADFLATGEVVGQRPMSQLKHTMNHIENVSGLNGRLVRPLSAHLLRPTQPEIDGIIDRDMLLSINGRSRKAQFDLAKKYNIQEYTSPAGGCLFTDAIIARRVKDILARTADVHAIDLYLLTIGRHYRINDNVKAIVSRNEEENNVLMKYMGHSDYIFIPDYKGPTVFVKGDLSVNEIDEIGRIIRRYGKPGNDDPFVEVFRNGSLNEKIRTSIPATEEKLERMRI